MLTLDTLPDELLFLILTHLPIYDLLQLSRTTTHLRRLSIDIHLHTHRRHQALLSLQHNLTHRPSKNTITPPQAWICLNRTHLLSRSISRSLTRIRISHSLSSRPSFHLLIQSLKSRSILPPYITVLSPVLAPLQCQIHKHRLSANLNRRLTQRPTRTSLIKLNILPEDCDAVSPVLLERRRRVIKEVLKDHLKAWIENRGVVAQRKAEELSEQETKTVKSLVRKLTAAAQVQAQTQAQAQSGSTSMQKQKRRGWRKEKVDQVVLKDVSVRTWDGAREPYPTRAKVLGLRRFWEGMTRPALT